MNRAATAGITPDAQAAWVAGRAGAWPEMRVFAFDHRSQMEEMPGADAASIGAFKALALRAAWQVADGRAGFGILCDHRLGAEALAEATGQALWIGRPVEWPGSRPLRLEPELRPDLSGLAAWPKTHVVKVLCFYHPDDDAAMKGEQEATVTALFHAARAQGLEFLLEVIPSKAGLVDDGTTAAIIQRFYDLGVFPDWWKLEPMQTAAAWSQTCAAITRNDAHTRGIVVLGLGAGEDRLAASFALAARFPLVKGFAVGRTIFQTAAREYFAGTLTGDEAIAAMAGNFDRLCNIWDKAQSAA